jgi:DNA invertase Pin-like site-specific DNA recombinase
VIAIIATVAKQERVRISQGVRAGLEVARANGRRLGRPKVVVDVARIANLRAHGRSWRNITEELGIGKGTAQRALAGLPKNL